MIEAQLHDGTILEFPDGTDPSVVQATVKRMLAGNAPQPPAPAGPLPGKLTEPAPPLRTDTGHIPWQEQDAPKPAPAPRGPLGSLMLGAQNVAAGVGNIAGMPVDLATMALNAPVALGTKAYNALVPDQMEIAAPQIESPALGSSAIRNAFGNAAREAGVPIVEPRDMTRMERLVGNVNTMGTEGISGGALFRPLATLARPGSTVQKTAEALSPKTPGGFAVDTSAGMGSGVGQTIAQDAAPNSPIAEFFSTLLGGFAGGRAAQVASSPRQAIDFGRRQLPDPATGTTRGTADDAARFVQERTSGNPAEVADQIGKVANEARLGGEPVPTAGIATGDIGLTALEKGARLRDPVPFQENDQRLRDTAQEKVAGLRDPNADPNAARSTVEADVAAQRAAVDAPIRVAYDEKAALQAENAQKQAAAEAERAAALNDQDQRAAMLRQQEMQAQQAEADLGGAVGARRGTEGAASERVAAAVDTAKAADEAKKSGLYREAEKLGEQTKVDPTPLIDDAAAVRAEISPLAGQSAKLNNILGDLERLAPENATVETGLLDAAGKPITRAAVPEAISAKDLIAMRPRLSAARDEASRMRRGDVVQRIDRINDGIASRLDDLAESGDRAALKWQEAEANFKTDYAPKYREGVGGQLDKAERAGTAPPPTAVAGKFVKAGAGGKEAAADLNRILAGAESEQAGQQAARDYVLADMAKTVGADGKINPARLRTWIAQREGVFSQMPELRAEVDGVLRDVINRRGATTDLQRQLEQAALDRGATDAATKQKIADVKANSRLSEKQKADQIVELERKAADVEREIQNNAASLLLDSDPKKAAARVFDQRDPVKAMDEITAKVSKDPAAAAGWKRAVTEHLIDRVTNTNTAITGTADGPVSVAKLKTFFDDNAAALSKVYSPAEMNALRRAHKILEPLGNLQRQATTGSATIENQALWKALDAGLLAVTGNAITAGMVMKRVKTVIGLFPNTGDARAQLVERMFFDPELAQHLLTREVKTVELPAWNKKLTRLLAVGNLAADDAQPEEK